MTGWRLSRRSRGFATGRGEARRAGVRDAKLAKHLEALRSYHLLGRGDFFQSFFEEAASLLALPPRANTAEADAAAPFAAAALKSSAFDDPLLPRFRLRFVSPGGGVSDEGNGAGAGGSSQKRGPNVRVPSYDSWDGLELEYATPWPLGLLLTRSVQRRYNHMFQYLPARRERRRSTTRSR